MNCEVCNTEIPQERLDILPNTKTCVKHSKEKKMLGIMHYGKCVLVDPDNKEVLRLQHLADEKERKNG